MRRAAAISAGVMGVLAGLALFANYERQLALDGQRTLRRHLYASQMNVAQQAWNDGNVAQTLDLLNAQWPRPGQEDLRGFEWRYLGRLCRRDARLTLRRPAGGVSAVAFSPDGKTLATCSWDHSVKLWDTDTKREVARLTGQAWIVDTLAFSPDGKTLATSGGGNLVKLWNVATRQPVVSLAGHRAQVWAVAFSPDGNTLATGSADKTIRLWRAASFAETDAPAGARAPQPFRSPVTSPSNSRQPR
jgi:eukaryotic-like serine/threonine-protein kinase